ncbi:MAG: response regulator [Bacilli bacterium]
MGARILVVDDELQIRRLLRVTLQAHGFTLLESATGSDGVVSVGMERPDLVILDLGLPDLDGTEVLRQIREWSQVPVIVLSVRDNEVETVAVLDSGADDYITKPFGMRELLARIRVALRHAAHAPCEPVIVVGEVAIDLAKRIVEKNGQTIHLTPIEYDLLKVMAVNAGRVLTHHQLVKQVWGDQNFEAAAHYLRVYIGHLRKKVENDPTRPTLIITEPGIGYRLLDFS